jgi:hypothetical protein
MAAKNQKAFALLVSWRFKLISRTMQLLQGNSIAPLRPGVLALKVLC